LLFKNRHWYSNHICRTVNPRLVPTYVTPLMVSETKLIPKFSTVSQRRALDAKSHSEILQVRLISFTNFNAQFLYSLTICMLHYNPRHVSSINMPIFRRKIVLSQHLVSSLYVNGCTLCRMRADCSAVCSHPAYCTVLYIE